MPKKTTKPLTKAEVAKYVPTVDPVQRLQEVMGFGLESAFNLGVQNGAVVAGQTNPLNNAANVDELPADKGKRTAKKKK